MMMPDNRHVPSTPIFNCCFFVKKKKKRERDLWELNERNKKKEEFQVRFDAVFFFFFFFKRAPRLNILTDALKRHERASFFKKTKNKTQKEKK